MITIAIKEIKRFMDKASHVMDTRMLPIYSYVKLVCTPERSYFEKHNGGRFVVVDVEVDTAKEETFIIETKALFGFVQFCRASEIKISQKGNNVKLDDGSKPISFQSVPDNFKKIDSHEGQQKFEISSEVLKSIVSAKSHSAIQRGNDGKPWICYVHIRKIKNKHWVIATRTEVTYFKGFTDVLPEVSLDADLISAIKDEKEQLSYYSVGNYDYFETLNTLYGFAKSETKCAEQVDKVLENFHSKDSFVVERRPIVDFCEMILAVNDTSVTLEIKFESKEKTSLKISFMDMMDNISSSCDIPLEEKTFNFDNLLFQPKNILTVLKDLNSEKIKVSSAHKNFIITTDEPDYIGAVMQLGYIQK